MCFHCQMLLYQSNTCYQDWSLPECNTLKLSSSQARKYKTCVEESVIEIDLTYNATVIVIKANSFTGQHEYSKTSNNFYFYLLLRHLSLQNGDHIFVRSFAHWRLIDIVSKNRLKLVSFIEQKIYIIHLKKTA